ncbi:MAG: protealysin inhibitor emfourin [Bradyrhizobium sp.]
MRITVSMPSTGIVYAPGLARPVVIDSDKLPTPVAQKLERLAAESKLFEPTEAEPRAAPDKLRDAQETVITVEAEGKERTLRIVDPVGSIANKSLRDFVALVREQAERLRQGD